MAGFYADDEDFEKASLRFARIRLQSRYPADSLSAGQRFEPIHGEREEEPAILAHVFRVR